MYVIRQEQSVSIGQVGKTEIEMHYPLGNWILNCFSNPVFKQCKLLPVEHSEEEGDQRYPDV